MAGKKPASNRRSGCPLNASVEMLGDRWSLLIIRDMMLLGYRTFKEFLNSHERIATNILADRLKRLEKYRIISAAPDPSDGRKMIYSLTAKGLGLAPALPEIWALLRPRKGIMLLGLLLMSINRVAGLALPFSPKYFFDDVIGKHQTNLLLPIVLVVIGATIVQGITSYSLTQLLSKSAQRMITEMRKRIQAHIGRLPVTYYDSHKTGELVSRIM